MSEFDYIKRNLSDLLAVIDGRARLVAVTKSASDDELVALCRLGVCDIAENRPQELKRRYELLSSLGLYPAMHQIGTLQRNKVKYIAPFCADIQSLDSEKLADEIAKEARKCGRRIPVLIEVNSAEEEQKSGVMPRDVPALADYVRHLDGIELCGLMTMGPVCDDPEELRPYFALTKRLFDTMTFDCDAPILSMGMSDSYRVAIEEGATLVRVGRTLFRK